MQYNVELKSRLFFTIQEMDHISIRVISNGWMESIGHHDHVIWTLYGFFLA